VLGIPNDRFGESIFAVIEIAEGQSRPTEQGLIEHVKQHLASYKAPRQVMLVTSLDRLPNGKADLKAVKAMVSRSLELA